MEFAVPLLQIRGWKHPLVKKVQGFLAQPCDGSDFKTKVRNIILTEGLMKNFLSMPFTASSAEGRRLTYVLTELQKDLPQDEMIQNFYWRFWDPEKDLLNAQLMLEAFGQKPVMVGARVA